MSASALTRDSRRPPWWHVALLYAAALCVLAVVVGVARRSGIALGTFLMEVQTVAKFEHHVRVPWYAGLVSNIGVIVWCATASICLFSGALLDGRRQTRESRRFFLFWGALTAVLMMDDFFLLHEVVFPKLHIHEKVTYASYGVVIVAGLLASRGYIRRTEYPLLFLALGFFALSLAADTLQDRLELLLGELRILLEDGAKFLGIVGWFGYFARTAFEALVRERTN